MAGDFSKPVNTDLYATILQVIRENFAELAKGLDATTSLNLPIGAIRFNSSANRWEKWNGATWDPLATTYDINAATSAKLATPRSIALGGDVSGSASFDGSANISITAAVADNSHNHGTDTITSGTLGDARLPSRINTVCKLVTDWNDAIENGWYQGDSAANGPNVAWYMGTVLAHNTAWITQTVHQFTDDGSTGTISYRREKNNGTWGSWYRIRLSEAEHAALWAAKTHTHSEYLPSAGGTITGSLTISNGAPTIVFEDTGETTRKVHCNSNLIGFLNDRDEWSFHSSNTGVNTSISHMIIGTSTHTTDGNIYMPWAGDWLSNLLGKRVLTDMTINVVGSYALCLRAATTEVLSPNGLYDGGGLYWCGFTKDGSSNSLNIHLWSGPIYGTWRCLGQNGNTENRMKGTLFQRVA